MHLVWWMSKTWMSLREVCWINEQINEVREKKEQAAWHCQRHHVPRLLNKSAASKNILPLVMGCDCHHH